MCEVGGREPMSITRRFICHVRQKLVLRTFDRIAMGLKLDQMVMCCRVEALAHLRSLRPLHPLLLEVQPASPVAALTAALVGRSYYPNFYPMP